MAGIGSSLSNPLAVFDPKTLKSMLGKDTGMVAGGAAAVAVGYDAIMEHAAYTPAATGVKTLIFDKAWKRTAAAVALGLLGGAVFWGKHRHVSYGIMGAMGAQVGRELYAMIKGAAAGAGTTQGLNMNGLNALPEEQELMSPLAASVLQSRRTPGGIELAADVIVQDQHTGLGQLVSTF